MRFPRTSLGPSRLAFAGACVVGFFFAGSVWAQEFPRALPQGQLPQDVRLEKLRTLNDYHPFQSVETKQAWGKRAAELRRQVLVATGLWPLPTKTPLRAVIHGLVERDDYTVEKVYFESFPGHYVTGSLYRPKNVKRGQRIPGILSPHGHWSNGRFHDHGEAELKKQLANGAERFPSGRHPLQARCVQLARMGCAVFHYDMVGYADSIQLDHRKSTMASKGLFSDEADLYQQNMMGIQTYNSIRALDFIETLPEVDRDRIGVTGASGGGTQTFILGAVDRRPDLLFPAVMVSTAMQGGCVCENASHLRVGAGNIDFAALAAPRPLGLTGADDWTVEIESKGKPDLLGLYQLLGAPANRFEVFPYLQYGHNYNAVSRQAMYGFVNRHFQLGRDEPVEEWEFVPLSREEMSVWGDGHPAPASRGAVHEQSLLRWWRQDSATQLAALVSRMPSDEGAAKSFRRIVGGGWRTILGRSLAEVGEIDYTLSAKEESDQGLGLGMTGLLTVSRHGEQVPALFLHPGEDWNGEVVLWVDARGKRAALNEAGHVRQEILGLVEADYSVMLIDTLLTGEFTEDGKAVEQARTDEKSFPGYTFGYNRSLFAKRVHDVLSAVAFVTTNEKWNVRKLHFVAPDPLGAVLALAARTQCGHGAVMGKTLVNLEGVRLADAPTMDHPWFVPGSVKYGDVPGLLALCAPAPVLVVGETEESLALAVASYLGTGGRGKLSIRDEIDEESAMAFLAE